MIETQLTASVRPGRILFLINSLAGGGAERVMIALLDGSRDRFADTPFSLALLDDDPDAYAPAPWLPVHRLATGGSLLRGVKQVRALVRRERPDLIVSFLTRANVIAATVGWLESIPTIISERVNTSAHLAGRRAAISRLLVRLSYRRAHRVIAVSQGVGDDLVANFGVSRDRVRAIPNPVDVAAIARIGAAPMPLEVGAPFFVAVGRLAETKNMMLLVQAYAEAAIGAHLVILGEGPERARLQAEIERLGVADRVMLAGFAANPFAVVGRARGYVSASNGEGFPNALVEAMALARPVLVTNCASGPSEILADRRLEDVGGPLDTPYGRLVPTNDRAALAQGLRWLDGQDDAGLLGMGAAGTKRAEEFGVDTAVRRYWQVFDEVAMPAPGHRND